MNIMKDILFFLIHIIIIMNKFIFINGINELNKCFNQEHSPLCFCRSISSDLFLTKLSLTKCNDFLSFHHCYQIHFYPPSFHLIQLIPQLSNLSHCLQDIHCLHTLNLTEYCSQCQILPSLLKHNNSYQMNTCFNLCEHNTSCGFVCLNQPIIISIHCYTCQGQRQNISCRCIKSSSSSTCFSSSLETTTPRWMQKRGFPAAAILALLIFAIALVVIAMKLIYHQLDLIDRRRSIAVHFSSLPISTPQSLSIIPHTQVQQLVVEIHRCEEENQLNILLLKEKTSSKN